MTGPVSAQTKALMFMRRIAFVAEC
jgi:hypothetical protein